MGRVGLLSLSSGLSGDMFLGALIGAGVPVKAMEAAVQSVCGPDFTLTADAVKRGGLVGTRVAMFWRGVPLEESGGPAPREERKPVELPAVAYRDLVQRIESATLDRTVLKTSLSVFRRLAETEAHLHGVLPTAVHFHELGSWDALADVVGAVWGCHALGLEPLYHGVIAVGGGTVEAAHGRLPVPVPVTLRLLAGRDCLFEPEIGELTTPTGAALLAELALPAPARLRLMPHAVGEGAGRADLADRPNLARLTIGEEAEHGILAARVAVIEASLDDATAEEAGHLVEALFEAGARDVTLTPLVMKKSRPGCLVRVIADAEKAEWFAATIVRLSPSLGARWRIEDRLELPRRIESLRLGDGEVRIKIATLPDGTERIHPEYEDLALLARRRGVSLASLRREVERLWDDRGER